MKNYINKKYVPYLFIAPCVILISIIIFYPLLCGVINSFYNVNFLINRPKNFIGLANFISLFNDKMFWFALSKSLIWTLCILVVTMLAGFIIALLLNQEVKGRRFFRVLILIPWVIPKAIGAITWKWIYAEQYGLLNHILQQFNIIENHQAWLADSTLAFWAVITVAIWKAIPFVAIVLLAGLQAIPNSLYEAARVDGANSFQVLWKITIPQIKNIALIVALLTSIWNFNEFDIIQVITRGGPGKATLLLPIYIYRLFLQAFDVSYASAMATVMLILMIVLSYFYIKNLVLESD